MSNERGIPTIEGMLRGVHLSLLFCGQERALNIARICMIPVKRIEWAPLERHWRVTLWDDTTAQLADTWDRKETDSTYQGRPLYVSTE